MINPIIKPDLEKLCTSHSAEEVHRIRSILLKLTRNGRKARILEVAEKAGVSESFIKYCYENKLLKGYDHMFGYDGGFYRKLRLV